MKDADHLTADLLVRAIDDELTASEAGWLNAHLLACQECGHKYEKLRSLSLRIESAVAAFAPEHSTDERESLARCLHTRERKTTLPPRRIIQGFGWALAIAATLAMGILLGPQLTHRRFVRTAAQRAQIGSVFEVDGETFQALPYSNPDLPLNAPQVVQMEVPVSSLTDAGIVFEPVSSEISAPDRSVLADVLLGLDGQPLGVHVLSAE